MITRSFATLQWQAVSPSIYRLVGHEEVRMSYRNGAWWLDAAVTRYGPYQSAEITATALMRMVNEGSQEGNNVG